MAVNNALIGALRAEATLESGKFVEGAKKLRSETQKTEAVVKKGFGAMGAAVKGFGGSIMAGLSLGVLAAAAKQALDFAAAIGTTAKQLGVTTKELQIFRYAAGQVGIKNAEVEKGLQNLGTTLSKAASGSTSATKALSAVGVTLDDIKTKSKTEIFGQIADQMAKQGGAAKNAAAGQAIFGEGMAKLAPLLDQGSAGFNVLAESAERLGIVLSHEQIQGAEETAAKLEAVKNVLAAQIAGVVSDNADSIVSLANALATLTSAIVNFLGSNPTLALGILGALAGSRFGPVGAAGGALAGSIAGSQMTGKSFNPATNPNKKLLQHNLNLARKRGDTAAVARLTAKLSGSPSTGIPAIPQFLAPAARGGGRRRRSRAGGRAPRDRSGEVAFQFDQESRRAQMDVLRAQQSLARHFTERAAIARRLLELEKQGQNAELNERLRRAERDFAEGKITAATLERAQAQVEQLRIEYDKKDALELQLINENEELDRQKKFNEYERASFDAQFDILQAHLGLATTASERRKIELEILNLKYRERKELLERIIRESKNDDERTQAEIELGNMGRQYGLDRAGVLASTRNPLEEWAATVPQTAAQLTEAIQSIQANGLDALADGLAEVITGTKSLGEAFSEIAKQIVADLIRMTIRMMIFRALSGIMGGAMGGGASGNILVTGLPTTPPGFARGGSFKIGGRGGTDRNTLALNGLPIARVSRGERINIANDNVNGGQRELLVHVAASKDFDVRVEEISGRQVAAAAPTIVRTAQQGVFRTLQRPRLP